MSRLFFFLLVVLVLYQCKNVMESPVDPSLDFDFFPVNSQEERIYEMMEIRFSGGNSDTVRYQLRERIVDSILVSENNKSYVLERSKLFQGGEEFEIDSLWLLQKTDRFIAITENGNPRIKLVFPVTAGREWDGNRLTNLPRAKYQFLDITSSALDRSYDQIISHSDRLIKVQIADIPKNIVNQNQQYEVYGKGVGLIEKNSVVLEFCTVNCDSTGQINSGRILMQNLISYEVN